MGTIYLILILFLFAYLKCELKTYIDAYLCYFLITVRPKSLDQICIVTVLRNYKKWVKTSWTSNKSNYVISGLKIFCILLAQSPPSAAQIRKVIITGMTLLYLNFLILDMNFEN